MKKLLQDKFRTDLEDLISQEKIDLESLKNDRAAMQRLTDQQVERNRSNKELIEFFIATNLAESAYLSGNTKICFELKRAVQSKSLSITNFDELKMAVEESTMTDFGIVFDNQLRTFQLKQYQGAMDTPSLIKSIVSILDSYGRRIGKHNLIIQMQGDGAQIDSSGIQQIDIDFEAVHEALLSYKIEGEGEILLSINEQNEKELLIQVFPELNKFETDYNFSAESWI